MKLKKGSCRNESRGHAQNYGSLGPLVGTSRQRQANLSTIGAGIVHGPSYVSIYNNPVLCFSLKKRSLSRAVRVRRVKRGLVAGGNHGAPQWVTAGVKPIPALQLDPATGA